MFRIVTQFALTLAFCFLAMGAGVQDKVAFVQSQVERDMKALLADQLGPGEFFAYAVVTPAEASGAAGKAEGGALLPYATLQVPSGAMKGAAAEGVGDFAYKLEVTLGFDERVPEAKRRILTDIVTARFGFDGANRVLKVVAAKLVTPKVSDLVAPAAQTVAAGGAAPVGDDKQARELERLKAENEKASLKLEAERSKLEAQKTVMELTQLNGKVQNLEQERLREKSELLARHEKELEEAKKALEAVKGADGDKASPAAAKTANAASANPDAALSPALRLAKDFQLAGVAALLAVLGLLAVFLGGNFFVKGFKPVSSAISAIGASLENAAKSIKIGGGAAAAPAKASAERDDGGGKEAKAVAVATEAMHHIDEAFMARVKEKIEVLGRQKSFSFMQVFGELTEQKRTLPMAAAILVSLDADAAQEIVKDLSLDDIGRIKTFLASDGGLARAQELKNAALSEFYGRISVAEFMGSPVGDLKDMGWLTRMNSAEMKELVLGLQDDERAVFLAVLKPQRAKAVLASAKNGAESDAVIKALGQVSQVTADQIKPLLTRLSAERGAARDADAGEKRTAVDGAQYLANIAADLPEAAQAKLFQAIGDNRLLEGMREHFIPFAMVKDLPNEIILEIFGERPDAQVALMLFDANEDVRKRVVDALPEFRREAVQDELRLLEGNKFYEARYRAQSGALQKEVSQYLLALNGEGLLRFENDGGQGAGGGSQAA